MMYYLVATVFAGVQNYRAKKKNSVCILWAWWMGCHQPLDKKTHDLCGLFWDIFAFRFQHKRWFITVFRVIFG